ncbi:Protein FAM75D1 [Fukomys damarensis]|uniref:Protein FAM75D1 n=1 Tax=Fukomys damarensis TaxID=885580 RepID=A0A091DXG6_FUKDA|nr:Protein FAM75D1 [Fukomys damarensis]
MFAIISSSALRPMPRQPCLQDNRFQPDQAFSAFALPSPAQPGHLFSGLNVVCSPGDSVPLVPSPPYAPNSQWTVSHWSHFSALPHVTHKKQKLFSTWKPLCPRLMALMMSPENPVPDEALFGGHSAAHHVKKGILRFLGSNNSSVLEREIRKTDDFLMSKEHEKKAESFAKQHEPDYTLTTARKRSEPAADQQHCACSSLWVLRPWKVMQSKLVPSPGSD